MNLYFKQKEDFLMLSFIVFVVLAALIIAAALFAIRFAITAGKIIALVITILFIIGIILFFIWLLK